MPEKEWFIDLGEFAIFTWRMTERGRVVAFRVVVLAEIDGETVCVTRYDTAHGFPHRDVLGRKSGLRHKLIVATLDYREAFEYALSDCKKNGVRYVREYFAR